jgi:L-fuculose-phosphate aldolase
MSEPRLRQELSKYSQRMWQRGWVANHDGNLSHRLRRSRLMCTPTAQSKIEIRPEMMLVVDESGKVLSGSLRPFSELNLHLAYYQARADVNAVVHAHPPAATALAAAGLSLDKPFLPEAVVSLGAVIPTVPLAMPGVPAVQAMGPYVDDYDALVIAGNGVICCGSDLEQAYLRLELVEHLAEIACRAHSLGGIKALPAPMLKPLLDARRRAGLGPEARGRSSVDAGGLNRTDDGQLASLVRREVIRVLKPGTE